MKIKTTASVIIFLGLLAGFVIGCSSSKSTASKDVSLTNTRWALKSLNGTEVVFPQGRKEIFLQFKQYDTHFNGFAGCNTINGKYEANIDGTMKMSGIISTRMACDILTVEQEFVQALETVNRYKVSGDELTLYADRKVVAVLFALYLR